MINTNFSCGSSAGLCALDHMCIWCAGGIHSPSLIAVVKFSQQNKISLLCHSQELQDDYTRFMDYTDGMFHSDYLIKLRHMGQKLAEKQITAVQYEDIDKKLEELQREPCFQCSKKILKPLI